MKKNLTILMMLMAFVGILSAQSGPKFNYSAVLRHHVAEYVTVDGDTLRDIDTLFHNSVVNVEITITKGSTVMYKECHDGVATDDNGFVSVVIGEGSFCGETTYDLSKVEWEGASLDATFTLLNADETTLTTMTNTIEVKPVPFALQAAEADLTTPLIVDYLKNELTIVGAKSVLQAFVDNNTGVNGGLEEDVEDLIEDSLKTRRAMDSLKEVAKAYLAQISREDLQQVYDILMGKPAAQKEAVKDYIKSIVENPSNTLPVARKAANELLAWYLNTYDLMPNIKEDVESVYHAAQEISAEDKAIIKDTVKGYLSQFAKSQAFIDIVSRQENVVKMTSDLLTIMGSITEDDAIGAFGWLSVKNPDVKAQLRTTLNGYIYDYTGCDYEGTDTTPSTTLINAVDATVTKAINGDHLVKKCTDEGHEYCH